MSKTLKELDEAKKKVIESNAENEEFKAQALNYFNRTSYELEDINKNRGLLLEFEKKKEELNLNLNLNSLLINRIKGETLSIEEQNKLTQTILTKNDLLENNIQEINSKIDQNIKNINDINKEVNIDYIKKSSIFSSNLDIQIFLDSLSKEELLAFSGLLLNGLVLNYVISIIFILYGDYLIKRFDLENKYPKLAKFIKIRRQLQNYFLKICFV